MKKFISGIAALAGLAILLVGIPTALVALAGNPIPSWETLVQGLTQPDWTGSFLTGHVLPVIAWVAWLTFAIGIVSVIPSAIRGIDPPRIRGLAVQQGAGRVLIGAVLVMFVGLGSATAATAATPHDMPTANETSVSAAQTPTPTTSVAPLQTSAPAVQETTSNPSVPVKNGDSLWSLAEAHLGDGNRFAEIAQLNYGVPQQDGGSLSENHFVNAGWTLQLPADATIGADKEITVQAGDTLETLAAAEYGDPSKAPVIFAASQSITQPDGTQIGNTGQVLPGYRLIAPDTTPAAIAPASSSPALTTPAAEPEVAPPLDSPAPQAEVSPAAEAPAEAAAPDTAPAASEQITEAAPAPAAPVEDIETAADTGEESAGDAFPVSTLWGAGGILAAGFLTLIGARRATQNRSRRVGQRIAVPSHDIAVTELELRAAEDPAGVDDIDRILHHLADWAYETNQELPKLFAVRLSPGTVELYLDQASELPEPFEAVSDDNCAWSIDPRRVTSFEPQTSAPYPALVTLGQDSAEGHILVDLEQIGALNLAGDPEMTEGALTAIAIELACSKWSEELRVSVVGFASELPSAFNTGRVRHIKNIQELVSDLEARAKTDSLLLEELDLNSSHDARISSKSQDPWPPEIILLAQLPDEETTARLAALIQNVPRVGIAAITQGHLAGEWSLDIGKDRMAKLLPAGIELQAQVVAGANYTNILSVLRSTIEEPQPAPHVVPEIKVAAVVATPAIAEPETSPELSPVIVPDSPASLIDIDRRKNRPAPAAEEIRIELPDAPFVRVLGNVRVENAHGVHPATVKGASVARATEVIAFLALHRNQSTEEYDQNIHPNNVMTANKRNPLITRARKWLDSTGDGQDYLVKFDVAKSYTLLDTVRTDWDVFQELVGPDPLDASDARLEAALELVTGQPFQGIRSGRGAWGWAELDQQKMIAAISDVAYEVAERAKETGNPALMLKAALRGTMVNPSSEIHKRHKLLAYAMSEDQEGFNRTVQQIFDQCEAMEEEAPEQETLDLINQLEVRFEKLKAS
ncbi:LysM peptidoglycan-binding domain-containing protein (plasmid) [Micrococcaceae bacterium Sec5.7]